MWTLRRGAGVLAVVALSILGGSASVGSEVGSGADWSGAEGATLPPTQVSDAELEDLRFFAEQEGVPLEEMVTRFAGVSEFTASVNDLRAKHPEALVHAVWGDGSGVVYVRPGYAHVAESTLAARGAPGSVTERDAMTEVERGKLASEVSAALPAGLADGSMVSVDPLGLGVTVSLLERAVARTDPSALDGARAVAAGVSRVLTVETVPAGPETTARGGRAYGSCTGAFVVRSGSTYGISTAHHCGSTPTSYDGSSTGTTTALSNRDVRWTRFTSGTPQYTFQSNWYSYTTATSSGDPVSGSPVCKFGMKTGKTCDTVTTTGNCVTYSGWPTFCGLFKTDNYYSAPGDSGGPWYYGSTARGVQSGRNTFFNYDLFSGVGSLNLLGVTVYTN